ncbi:MAG: sugar ABC transporter permease [Treponema sp.]|nr:sugar ABC transporter permease [Treponema sp.]MCL2271766.1 sugar ABC transporter permease [Treponema sp.]
MKKMQVISRAAAQEARAAYFFLIPAFLGLTILTYGPLLVVLALSFSRWRAGAPEPIFNGLENYIRLFTEDHFFVDSIKVTAYFTFISVIGSMIYSLAVAMLLNRKIPARGFFRAVFYVPYVLPAVAVYIGWSWLYDSNFGLFNFILSVLNIDTVHFIADTRFVVPSLAIIAVWLSGNLIVIFLAGLQNVPRVYYEAAEIDGASSWQRFLHVTIPGMSPIIFYNLLMAIVTNMQVVTPALALTRGGPGNSSMFMTFLMYRNAFIEGQLGYASAISFIFFIIVAVFTAIIFITSREWVFYEGDK